uniref:RNase H type-1 domain-containing protein n=1 Tax=Trichogramma kaykai TaxID=54128 RepID=A0ABD2XQX7_9HYME
MGLLLPLLYRDALPLRQGNFLIFSDSESALKALSSFQCNSPLISKLRLKLFIADKNNINVVLQWIPSHVGILGNEKADTMAKEATSKARILDKPIPVSDHYAIFKKESYKESEKLAIDLSSEKGTFYFQNFYSDSPKLWFKVVIPEKYCF